jgi:hypothetical protein
MLVLCLKKMNQLAEITEYKEWSKFNFLSVSVLFHCPRRENTVRLQVFNKRRKK